MGRGRELRVTIENFTERVINIAEDGDKVTKANACERHIEELRDNSLKKGGKEIEPLAYHALDLGLIATNGLLELGEELLVEFVLRAHEGVELNELSDQLIRFLTDLHSESCNNGLQRVRIRVRVG